MALLKNFWYVAEQSAAIANKPKRITILEQELVLFRNLEGQVIALNNLCAHRGGNLEVSGYRLGRGAASALGC